MRYITGGFIAFGLAILQASSVEQFRIMGVTPNLTLVFLVAWLVVRGLDDVLPMIAVAGITTGLVGLQTPGVVLLALMPIVALGFVREMHVIHSDLALVLAFAFAATVAYEMVLLLGTMATGGVLDIRAGVTSAVLPAAAVNVVLTPFVYVPMRLAKPATRSGRLAY